MIHRCRTCNADLSVEELTWTTETPNKPGWYWLKWGSDATPSEEEACPLNITLAMIRFTFQPGPITPELFGGPLEVLTIGNDAPDPMDEFHGTHQWAGPLEPPA